jgi:phage-related protein
MRFRRSIPGVALLAVALLAAPRGLAQRRGMGGGHPQPHVPKPEKERPAKPEKGPHPVDEFLRMTPQQRQQALSRLPEERRRKIQEQIDRIDRLPPEQRERLRQQYERFRQLPPERQQAIRKAMQKLQNQPPDRQQAIREELNRLRAMPAGEREEHLNSPDVKSRYNKHEREILGDLSEALPPGE